MSNGFKINPPHTVKILSNPVSPTGPETPAEGVVQKAGFLAAIETGVTEGYKAWNDFMSILHGKPATPLTPGAPQTAQKQVQSVASGAASGAQGIMQEAPANITTGAPNIVINPGQKSPSGEIIQAPNKKVIQPGAAATQTVSGTVWGQLSSGNTRLIGVLVTIGGKTATTDSQGSYTVTGLQTGVASVGAFTKGYTPYSGSTVIGTGTNTQDIYLTPLSTATPEKILQPSGGAAAPTGNQPGAPGGQSLPIGSNTPSGGNVIPSTKTITPSGKGYQGSGSAPSGPSGLPSQPSALQKAAQNVTAPPAYLEIGASGSPPYKIPVGGAIQLHATFYYFYKHPDTGDQTDVTSSAFIKWSVVPPNVASINSHGALSGLAAGIATVTATYQDPNNGYLATTSKPITITVGNADTASLSGLSSSHGLTPGSGLTTGSSPVQNVTAPNAAATAAYQTALASTEDQGSSLSSAMQAAKAAGVTTQANPAGGTMQIVQNTGKGQPSVVTTTATPAQAAAYNKAIAQGYSPYQAAIIAGITK